MRDLGLRSLADPPFLEVQVAPVPGVHVGLDALVGGREQPQAQPEGPSDAGGEAREGFTRSERGLAMEVEREVAVPEGEPARMTQALELGGDHVRLVGAAPPPLGIDEPREGVGDGVEVGGHAQPEQVEVVGDVHDDREVRRIERAHGAPQEAGRTDAACEHRHRGHGPSEGRPGPSAGRSTQHRPRRSPDRTSTRTSTEA